MNLTKFQESIVPLVNPYGIENRIWSNEDMLKFIKRNSVSLKPVGYFTKGKKQVAIYRARVSDWANYVVSVTQTREYQGGSRVKRNIVWILYYSTDLDKLSRKLKSFMQVPFLPL